MKTVAKILATFFGLGYFPLAPGTLASLVTAVAYGVVLWRMNPVVYIALLLALVILGLWASATHSRALNTKDPGVVVVDEVCGQMAALILVPRAWPAILLGLGLFRFFDVVKPFPIRRAERLPLGLGIMADDMLAAAYAALALHLVLYLATLLRVRPT